MWMKRLRRRHHRLSLSVAASCQLPGICPGGRRDVDERAVITGRQSRKEWNYGVTSLDGPSTSEVVHVCFQVSVQAALPVARQSPSPGVQPSLPAPVFFPISLTAYVLEQRIHYLV
jgi:hypothetical protein